MKYFTLEWLEAKKQWIQELGRVRETEPNRYLNVLQMEPDQVRKPEEEYKQYYASVKEQLPPQFLAFQQSYGVKEGFFSSLSLNIEKQEAQGSFQVWYYPGEAVLLDASLFYSGVKYFRTSEVDGVPFQHVSMIEAGHGEILHEEVEVRENGLFEHRMWFESGIEFVVGFSGFEFTVDEPDASTMA